MDTHLKYESFKKNGFTYPPRCEYKCPAADLNKYDNGQYLAQPKYNGSAAIVFTNGRECLVYNRHRELLALLSNFKEIEFRRLAQSKNWFVYAGEYLNKSKYGETGVKERNKFVIWDILVWDGNYLIGSTLTERLDLLENVFPCQRAIVGAKTGVEMYDHLCCTPLNGIYKAPTYMSNFTELYKQIVKVDLYEGLVLKKKDSKLTFGMQELNNHDWQVKCRKETRNYAF